MSVCICFFFCGAGNLFIVKFVVFVVSLNDNGFDQQFWIRSCFSFSFSPPLSLFVSVSLSVTSKPARNIFFKKNLFRGFVDAIKRADRCGTCLLAVNREEPRKYWVLQTRRNVSRTRYVLSFSLQKSTHINLSLKYVYTNDVKTRRVREMEEEQGEGLIRTDRSFFRASKWHIKYAKYDRDSLMGEA